MLKLFKTRKDPEDPKVEWVCILPFLRLKFYEGEFVAWYNPLKMTKI